MPKLPTLTPRKLLKKLIKIGFMKDHSTGSHIIMYHKQIRRRAVIPMHLTDIPKGTLNSLLKEAGISRNEILKV